MQVVLEMEFCEEKIDFAVAEVVEMMLVESVFELEEEKDEMNLSSKWEKKGEVRREL